MDFFVKEEKLEYRDNCHDKIKSQYEHTGQNIKNI